METELRTLLYSQPESYKVAFNPVEPEPFDLVDLTKDVTNSTRIYHLRTECLREALEGARLIVADSEPLANVVRQVIPRAVVATLPFGGFAATPEQNEQPFESRRPPSGTLRTQPVVGLLNYNDDMEMNNTYAVKLLKHLRRNLLVFGRALPGIEADVVENFGEFCARCDILLLPSLPGAINSITLPLAVMANQTAVLAHNAPGYYNLDAATGVQLLPDNPDAWRLALNLLESQPAKLRTMQERNAAYAGRLSRHSVSQLGIILAGLPPQRPTGDCGCTKKKATLPEPELNQPIENEEQSYEHHESE